MAVKKMSRASRLKKKQEELQQRGNGGGSMLYLKEGTQRVRLLPTLDDEADFVIEVVQFYLGGDIKGVFSPSTFGLPCAVMDKYNELKASDDPDDKDLAKSFIPKKKFLSACIAYADEKGKTVNEDRGICLVQLTTGLYQEIIDYYLDEDEWGDMTDPSEGYDLKLKRSGTGLNTEYSAAPCRHTKLIKKYEKGVDTEKMVKDQMPTFAETKEKIGKFLGIEFEEEEEEEEEAPPKKKKTLRKKKRRNADV